jgi:tRNA A-37 threonylcarbamoyl transferase component Bud32
LGVLVTRLIHGESLGQSGQALGDDQLKDAWEQVARLHAARIAHRDLRRANIVIDDDGRPWIVDFGFAEAARPTGSSPRIRRSCSCRSRWSWLSSEPSRAPAAY